MIRLAHHCSGRPKKRRRGTIVALRALTSSADLFLGIAIDLESGNWPSPAQNAADVRPLNCARSPLPDRSQNTYTTATPRPKPERSDPTIIRWAAITCTQAHAHLWLLTTTVTQAFRRTISRDNGVCLQNRRRVHVDGRRLAGRLHKNLLRLRPFLPNVTAATTGPCLAPRAILPCVIDFPDSCARPCLRLHFYKKQLRQKKPHSLPTTYPFYPKIFLPLFCPPRGMQGPSTIAEFYDHYLKFASNFYRGNSSYSLTYVNNFYQRAPMHALGPCLHSCAAATAASRWCTLPPRSFVPGGPVLPPAS